MSYPFHFQYWLNTGATPFMFEFSIIRKYLLPQKKNLSLSLIAIMSFLVISMVVWLVLVFLSVTEGIERSWLEKLTTLNAPLRINPTPTYFDSYYYRIDSLSDASNYSLKSIQEKLESSLSDPYSPHDDMEIPYDWPAADCYSDGSIKDPVKKAFGILETFRKNHPGMMFQEYELSGALMRLQMLRSNSPFITAFGNETQSFLTQASYVATFPEKSPTIRQLLLPPTIADLNHLFFLANRSQDHGVPDLSARSNGIQQESFKTAISRIIDNISILELKSPVSFWKIPPELIPEEAVFFAIGYMKNGQYSHFIIPDSKQNFLAQKKSSNSESLRYGLLIKQKNGFSFKQDDNVSSPIVETIPLIINQQMSFRATLIKESLENAKSLRDVRFRVASKIQHIDLVGILNWDGLEISKADIKTQFKEPPAIAPPWVYTIQNSIGRQDHLLPGNKKNEWGVVVSKGFQDNGVKIGDRGHLSYSSSSAASVQEQQLPVFVAGFYDPGIMGSGNKSILVPRNIAHTLCMSSSSFNVDKTSSNGIQVFFPNPHDALKIKKDLAQAFKEANIDPYWKISSFREYDFVKDLLEQFQSDKYLFTLIGMIILAVACSNIISLLILLVNDKKKEIGILQAMGASPRSIASIFALCGILMGTLSSLVGTAMALLTLRHIDKVVGFLSFLQGHEAFNSMFYGKSLPNHLSGEAVLFILIATPLISFLAGLIPAIKASRLRPSLLLRSE